MLPISYGDALPILKQLKGPVAPAEWRGALPVTYHLGPGPAQLHMKLSFEWKNRPLYNVMVTIPGTTRADEWVIFGNHHDAWVMGADDPISGASSLMETARGLGELLKAGWTPVAHDQAGAVGRRRVGPARLNRVGGEARRRAETEGGGLHQHRRHR